MPVVANKNSKLGLRRYVICVTEISSDPPSRSLYFEIFFVYFLPLIVDHCIPIGNVCLALQITLLKYDMSLIEDEVLLAARLT